MKYFTMPSRLKQIEFVIASGTGAAFQTKRPNLTEDIMPENIVIKLVVIQYANGKFDGRSYQNGELIIGNNYFVHRRGFEDIIQLHRRLKRSYPGAPVRVTVRREY